jgi:hypothetical protein
MPRGGKRQGSGAPKKSPDEKGIKTSIQIPGWMLEQIDLVDGKRSRSKVIVDVLSKFFFKCDINKTNV